MTFRPKVLLDIDGPCAAMIPAFLDWFHDRFMHRGMYVAIDDIKYHNDMGRSPLLTDIDTRLRMGGNYPLPGPDGGFGGAYLEFMRQPDVYSRFVKPVPGSQKAVEILRQRYDLLFVTALMRRANAHVPDKLDWIGKNFPGVPIATVPSEYKNWVTGTFAVDDRYDTCSRWEAAGVRTFMFKMPWNEAPACTPAYDWAGILEEIIGRRRISSRQRPSSGFTAHTGHVMCTSGSRTTRAGVRAGSRSMRSNSTATGRPS